MTVIKGKFTDDVPPDEILEGVAEYDLEEVFVSGKSKDGELLIAHSTQDEMKLIGQLVIAIASIVRGFFR